MDGLNFSYIASHIIHSYIVLINKKHNIFDWFVQEKKNEVDKLFLDAHIFSLSLL